MTPNEVKVLFKAVQDTSVKKVIDNIKGEVRSLGRESTDVLSKASETFKKLNPGLFGEGGKPIGTVQAPSAAKISGITKLLDSLNKWGDIAQGTVRGLKVPNYGKALAGIQGLGDIANLGTRTIQGLKQPNYGRALAGIHAMGSFDDLHKPKATGLSAFLASPIGKMATAFIGVATLVELVKKAFQLLLDAVRRVMQAINDAAKTYAKSLTSGLSTGFVVGRQNIASVLGVDEKDVIQFGAALQFLSGRLDIANRTLVDTNRTLTATAWNWRIMGINLKAVWAEIAAGIAPALNRVTELISVLSKLVVVSGVAKAVGFAIGAIIDIFTRLIAVGELFGASILVAITAVVDSIRYMVQEVNNTLAKLHIPGFSTKTGANFSNTKEAAALLEQLAKLAIGGNRDTAPAPQSFMRQIPAAAWQRMGLAIGIGSNPAAETAKNTKRTADLLQAIVHGRNGVPRGNQFGLSPTTANP